MADYGPYQFTFAGGDPNLPLLNDGAGLGSFNSLQSNGDASLFTSSNLHHARSAGDPTGRLTQTIPAIVVGVGAFEEVVITFWFRLPTSAPSGPATIVGMTTNGADGLTTSLLQINSARQLVATPAAGGASLCPNDPISQQLTDALTIGVWYPMALVCQVANSASPDSYFDANLVSFVLGNTGQKYGWAYYRNISNFSVVGWVLGSHEAVTVSYDIGDLTVYAQGGAL